MGGLKREFKKIKAPTFNGELDLGEKYEEWMLECQSILECTPTQLI